MEELNSQKSVGGKKRQEEHLAISLRHVYVPLFRHKHNRPPDSYRGEPAPLEHWRERGQALSGVPSEGRSVPMPESEHLQQVPFRSIGRKRSCLVFSPSSSTTVLLN